MQRPVFSWVLVGWLCAMGAVFLAIFELDPLDDYAAWIPVTVAGQLPAFLALRPGSHEAPLSVARRWALAMPAAVVAGIAVFWIALPIGSWIWEPRWLELRPMLLAMCLGFVAVIAAAVRFYGVLSGHRHPQGARRVLLAVTAVGTAGLGMMALRFGHVAIQADLALWLVVGVPVAWTLPLWLLLAVRRPEGPELPIVIVAR